MPVDMKILRRHKQSEGKHLFLVNSFVPVGSAADCENLSRLGGAAKPDLAFALRFKPARRAAVKCSEFLRECPSAVSRLLGHLWSAPVTTAWSLCSCCAGLGFRCKPEGQQILAARSWNLSRRWPSLALCVPNRFSR